jgi:hypothetical protein
MRAFYSIIHKSSLYVNNCLRVLATELMYTLRMKHFYRIPNTNVTTIQTLKRDEMCVKLST